MPSRPPRVPSATDPSLARIVFVDVDFQPHQRQLFQLNAVYDLVYRQPSQPAIPTGISLATSDDGTGHALYCGWIRDFDRVFLDLFLRLPMRLRCRVVIRNPQEARSYTNPFIQITFTYSEVYWWVVLEDEESVDNKEEDKFADSKGDEGSADKKEEDKFADGKREKGSTGQGGGEIRTEN